MLSLGGTGGADFPSGVAKFCSTEGARVGCEDILDLESNCEAVPAAGSERVDSEALLVWRG